MSPHIVQMQEMMVFNNKNAVLDVCLSLHGGTAGFQQCMHWYKQTNIKIISCIHVKQNV